MEGLLAGRKCQRAQRGGKNVRARLRLFPGVKMKTNTVVLFAQPIITRPETKRLVLTLPISSLGAVLRQMSRQPNSVEHVYDF